MIRDDSVKHIGQHFENIIERNIGKDLYFVRQPSKRLHSANNHLASIYTFLYFPQRYVFETEDLTFDRMD